MCYQQFSPIASICLLLKLFSVFAFAPAGRALFDFKTNKSYKLCLIQRITSRLMKKIIQQDERSNVKSIIRKTRILTFGMDD